MPRIRLAATAALVALLAVPALAADAPARKKAAAAPKTPCLTQAEFEAEQAIRLHTELMVVGLTCQHMDPKEGPSLFARYKQFTVDNQSQVQGWEKAMIGHFRKAGVKNPTREFDSFRTRLANETSQRAIALTTPIFCETHVADVNKALAMKTDAIRQDLASEATVRLASAPRCDRPGAAPAAEAKPATAKPAAKPAKADAKPAPAKAGQ